MTLSNRSFAFMDPWLQTAYLVTFIMSWMGIPLLTRWWGFQTFSDDTVRVCTQIAFVGAVAYPLTALTLWRRGAWLEPMQWNCVVGSGVVAILFGGWLWQNLFTWAMLTILILAAAGITIIATVKVLAQARR